MAHVLSSPYSSLHFITLFFVWVSGCDLPAMACTRRLKNNLRDHYVGPGDPACHLHGLYDPLRHISGLVFSLMFIYFISTISCIK